MSGDLLTLLFSAGQYISKGRGEYAGPCPACGGHDRFIVWPNRTEGRAYYCRQCGIGGDRIQALIDFGGMDFKTACETLDIRLADGRGKAGLAGGGSHRGKGQPKGLQNSFPAGQRKESAAVMPSKAWSRAAGAWLAECQRGLETNADAWRLLAERFLTLDTCRAAGIGWNGHKAYAPREAWGLPPGASGGDKLLLPAGLVLPVRRGGHVVGLTVRCSEGGGPRYRDVAGGASLPFAIGQTGRAVMLVESVLDACLVWQEGQGRMAAVATFGSAKGFDEPCLKFIQQAPQIFGSSG